MLIAGPIPPDLRDRSSVGRCSRSRGTRSMTVSFIAPRATAAKRVMWDVDRREAS